MGGKRERKEGEGGVMQEVGEEKKGMSTSNMYMYSCMTWARYCYVSLTNVTSSNDPSEPAVDCLLLLLPTEEMVPSPEAGVWAWGDSIVGYSLETVLPLSLLLLLLPAGGVSFFRASSGSGRSGETDGQ